MEAKAKDVLIKCPHCDKTECLVIVETSIYNYDRKKILKKIPIVKCKWCHTYLFNLNGVELDDVPDKKDNDIYKRM